MNRVSKQLSSHCVELTTTVWSKLFWSLLIVTSGVDHTRALCLLCDPDSANSCLKATFSGCHDSVAILQMMLGTLQMADLQLAQLIIAPLNVWDRQTGPLSQHTAGALKVQSRWPVNDSSCFKFICRHQFKTILHSVQVTSQNDYGK